MESSELARFEAVVLPHLDAAYTLARYLTRNEHDAEDVVQDACLAIVRNTAFSSRRRQRPDAVVFEFDEAQHSGSVADEHPEAALLRGAAKESLGRALDRLAPEFREVIVLRELEGLSYKEIGDVAGVPVGTVMSRLSRARTRLQQALREEGER